MGWRIRYRGDLMGGVALFATFQLLVFLSLMVSKLTGLLHLSWMWVFTPLWVSWAAGSLLLIGMGSFLLLASRRR